MESVLPLAPWRGNTSVPVKELTCISSIECGRFVVMLNKMIQFSAYLQSVRLYGRLIHGLGSNITVRQYCHDRHQDEDDLSCSEVKSLKYPDYKIVYRFPEIRSISALIGVKRNQTIFTGACIPVTTILHMLDVISYNDCIGMSCISSLITVWLHFTFYVVSNLVGFVYYKEDDGKVIISYIDYWGKRTDLKTSVKDIIPITDTPLNIAHKFYRKLEIPSCKQKLKISIRYGKITEKKHFETIFGSV